MSMDRQQAQLMATPSGHAQVRQKLRLYRWQHEALNRIMPEYSRCALRTCNESGKTSFVIAPAIVWHMDVFPGSLVVTTSASNRQIKFQLYPQLKRITGRWDGWSVRDSNEYSVRAPNGSLCVSYSTDDPGLMEGFHEWPSTDFMKNWIPPEDWDMGDFKYDETVPLFIIVDEGKGIDDVFYDAIDRCRPTRFLAASSPGDPMGRFYDYFHSWKEKFEVEGTGEHNLQAVSYRDCPHLLENRFKKREIELGIKLRGRDDAWVRSSAFGEFAQSGERMVFDLERVDEAMSNMIPHYDIDSIRAAVDLSGGGDETVMYARRGNDAKLEFSSHERDAVLLTEDLIINFERLSLRGHMVRVDEGGLGDPICDILASRGYEVERIDFGSEARNSNKYRNKRAEMYFELANNIAKGLIRLERDDELREQLGWQKYIMKDGSGLLLMSKSKMPRSPDRADTLAMLFDDLPELEDYGDQEERTRRMLSPSLPTERRTGFQTEEQEIGEPLLYSG